MRKLAYHPALHTSTRPHGLAHLFWLLAALVAVLSIGACRQGMPVLDTAPSNPDAAGTISGTARGPDGTSAVEGRAVEVVNLQTGERQQVTTNNAGGFTFKVRPGKYRVILAIRDGETLVKQPGVIDVKPSDLDAHADFVLGSSRLVRPRFQAPRGDDGLGAPIA